MREEKPTLAPNLLEIVADDDTICAFAAVITGAYIIIIIKKRIENTKIRIAIPGR